MFFVYLLRNQINGKLYVGKSNDPDYRFRKHKEIAAHGPNHSNNLYQAIHAAIRKYGHENFVLKVVEEVESEELSYQLETMWIKTLRANGFHLYNENDGGLGGIGFKHSQETKRKMSEAKAGKFPESLRGKAVKGSDHYSAKLTEADVVSIKAQLARGVRNRDILQQFPTVSRSLISAIKHGRAWSHIR